MMAKGIELYEFRVRGRLDSHWENWLEGLTIKLLDNAMKRLSMVRSGTKLLCMGS